MISRYTSLLVGLFFISSSLSARTWHVATSGNDAAAGTNWLTAKQSIQSAIDAAQSGDTVLVTNGVYDIGGSVASGMLTNRVAITKPITVRSVNGSEVTVIKGGRDPYYWNNGLGDSAIRCVYLTNGAFLVGFTLSGGFTHGDAGSVIDRIGGGALCEPNGVISNCHISANTASLDGAGVFGGRVFNSTISQNYAYENGGALFGSEAYNCTLSLNEARNGGGAYTSLLFNCTIAQNNASEGGGAYGCTLHECTVVNNGAGSGGGVFDSHVFSSVISSNSGGSGQGGGATLSILTDCEISHNEAEWGGGTALSTLTNCLIYANSAKYGGGGGVYGGKLYNCRVLNNSTERHGGGAHSAVLYSCLIYSNSAENGGGVDSSILHSSVIVANTAKSSGGGVSSEWYSSSKLLNCTVVGNNARSGGGIDGSVQADNSIIYYNQAIESDNNYFEYSSSINFTCSYPAPRYGIGNISRPPQFIDFLNGNYALSDRSPCINSGSNSKVSWEKGADGNPRISDGVVDIGAFEFVGTRSTNTVTIYVSTNGNDLLDGLTWSNAKKTIQAAIDVAWPGDIVLVDSGVYDTGLIKTNEYSEPAHRVIANMPITLKSVNGPESTIIQGPGANSGEQVRCVYLAAGSILDGFTVSGGNTWDSGAGVWCESNTVVITNCIIASNASGNDGGGVFGGKIYNSLIVSNSAYNGGGTFGSELISCRLVENISSWRGGGGFVDSHDKSISNCTFIANLAGEGGGVYGGTIYNSAFEGNSAQWGGGGGAAESILHNCIISSNSAGSGGGAYNSSVYDSLIAHNLASGGGGGVWNWTNSFIVSNCVIFANNAGDSGGGVYRAGVYNSTIQSNSASWDGGGTYWSSLHNSTVSENSAHTGGGVWCESTNTPVWNCLISANTSINDGGGVYRGSVIGCILKKNVSFARGGGANNSVLINSIISDNSARWGGGGLSGGSAFNCDISSNTVEYVGGGVYGGVVQKSRLESNIAGWGGGIAYAVIHNSILINNSARYDGGGVYSGTNYSCTIVGNVSGQYGGGASRSEVVNSIVYYNTNTYYWSQTHNHHLVNFIASCTMPMPTGAVGVVTNEPLFADLSTGDFGLLSESPCINSGSNNYVYNEVDFGGNQRILGGTVDMGAFESPYSSLNAIATFGGRTIGGGGYFSGATVEVSAVSANLRWGFSAWDDGNTNANRLIVVPDNGLMLTAIFTQYQYGPLTFHVATNGHDENLGGSWLSPKKTIQSAIDDALTGDTILVSNGVYEAGGRAVRGLLTNRVAIVKPLMVTSVNGPNYTFIKGSWDPVDTNGNAAVRCVYITNGASLVGFTATGGATRRYRSEDGDGDGGGIWAESSAIISNCLVSGNVASTYAGGVYGGTIFSSQILGNDAYQAGGVYSGTLYGCSVSANSARHVGGAGFSRFYNSTVSENLADGLVGGAYASSFFNSIVFHNKSRHLENYFECDFEYSCTAPMPTSGIGNITNDPQFATSYRISANSPCLSAGSASYAAGFDIDGEPWKAPPSMGCDEPYQGTITDSLSVSVIASWTNIAIGYPVKFTGSIAGNASSNIWHYGDGYAETNRLFAERVFHTPGIYPVRFTAFNAENPGGVTATAVIHVSAQRIHYVRQDNPDAQAPFLSWSNAASNIQDAIDASTQIGALILVTNGFYSTGGRVVHGQLTNRVAITKPISVRSVNGPSVTAIVGNLDPVSTNGDNAVRCVYMINGSFLSGFTITNGATRNAGDWEFEARGGGVYCEPDAVISNSVVTGCYADNDGGGIQGGRIYNCQIIGNHSGNEGGGTSRSYLSHCLIRNNIANDGGGTFRGVVLNCRITENYANFSGGGISEGFVYGSAIYGNSSGEYGGGSAYGTIINTTISVNSAQKGGGTYEGSIYNSVVYHNSALIQTLNNHFKSDFNYSCTLPMPIGGDANISGDPQLTGSYSISSASPCIGAGESSYATGVDLMGNSWERPPSMGCLEQEPGNYEDELAVSITASHTNTATDFEIRYVGIIHGIATSNIWEIGDGSVVTNQLSVNHYYRNPGTFTVRLTAFNDNYPAGVSATTVVSIAAQQIHYVSIGNTNPVSPYASWLTAATNIQDAIDVASQVGALILVSNGVYATGGRVVDGLLTNRVAVTKPLTVRSVNGPHVTAIYGAKNSSTTNGDDAVRCVYLVKDSVIDGFTIANGATRDSSYYDYHDSVGGGVYADKSAVVLNAIIENNNASYAAGVHGGKIMHSIIRGNMALNSQGGAYDSIVANSIISDNYANYDAGTSECILFNCTVVANTSRLGVAGVKGGGVYNSIVYLNESIQNGTANHSEDSWDDSIYYSLTEPMPSNGIGNVSFDPLFVDVMTADYRLRTNSPALDIGFNEYVIEARDILGLPRISNGRVDLGAHEMQLIEPDINNDGIPDSWLIGYGLSVTNMSNQTIPGGGATYRDAYFHDIDPRMTPPERFNSVEGIFYSNFAGMRLLALAPTSSNRLYDVLWTTNLMNNQWTPFNFNIRGNGGSILFPLPADSEIRIYRLGVKVPPE